MKINKIIYLLIATFILASCTPDGKEGTTKSEKTKSFVSEKYKFEIDFPRAPQEKTDKISAEGMEIEYTLFSCEKDDKTYFVSVNGFPRAVLAVTSSEILLSSAKAGAMSQLTDAKLINEKEIKYEKYDGVEIEVEGKKEGISTYIKGRAYLIGSNLFQIYEISLKNNVNIKKTNKFLNSFKIRK